MKSSSLEPEKVTDVQWRELHYLPRPLFEPFWGNLRKIHPHLFEKPAETPAAL